jgi:hypothetical protein
MTANNGAAGATIDNLLAQMSRGQSVLNDWDSVLNLDEDLVNRIFQAQFQQSAQDAWKTIVIAYCQVFPDPSKTGALLAVYTGVKITLTGPSLTLPIDGESSLVVYFKATGNTGTAIQSVPATFDCKRDGNPADPTLQWTYTNFDDTDFTGKVPLASVGGTAQGSAVTRFVLDFPSGSFLSSAFNSVKDPTQLHLQLTNYLASNDVQYTLFSIAAQTARQMPQMAPHAFKMSVVVTNENKRIFQLFLATQGGAAPANTSVAVNEPLPDGYSISAMFNQKIVNALTTSLMVQAFLFLQQTLIFPGQTALFLGPQFTPFDALILGTLDVQTPAPIIPVTPTSPIYPAKDTHMLDIQNTRQLTVPGQSAVTVYQDDTDSNLWYLPPIVTWATDPTTGLQELSVIQYNQSAGALSGFCRLTVQLTVDPVQAAALASQIPGSKLAQFDWISSQAFFTYTVDGKTTTIGSEPSGFGSQSATFSLPLPDQKSLTAFINAFSSGASGGTFSVSYQLAAQTRLPAVTVVSKFDSTLAYKYQVEHRFEIQTEYHSDTWGHHWSDQVLVYVGDFVHEMLSQTQASTITVTPGQALTPALLALVDEFSNNQNACEVKYEV